MKKFFSFLWNTKQSKSEKINKIIDNDPVLKKLDQELSDLNAKAYERIKDDEVMRKVFKSYGIDL